MAGRLHAREASERRSAPRGRLVEFVRLNLRHPVRRGRLHGRHPRGDVPLADPRPRGLGTSTGFVLGGVLGRQTATAVRSMEEELRKVPAAEIVAGVGGLVAGLAVAALLSVPVGFLSGDR